MKRLLYILPVFLAGFLWLNNYEKDASPEQVRDYDYQQVAQSPASPEIPSAQELYREMVPAGQVNYTAFEQAVAGYRNMDGIKKQILTLIDFSKPSSEERLYVFDMNARKLLYTSHVAHGRNSGANHAVWFSNRPGSYQSSLGFFITESTYNGRNGYSLIINGLEPGINDKAKERAIVIHGSRYCDPKVVAYKGQLGRSLGCPALPPALTRPIINTIKDGSLLYIFSADADYLAQSSVLNKYRPTDVAATLLAEVKR